MSRSDVTTAGAAGARSDRNPQLNKNGELVHLLSVEGLPPRPVLGGR